MYKLKVLVACECSQIVTSAFLRLGHDAWSCDILPCCGDFPERHICDNVLNHLVGWDLIIAHPPCTFLSNAANSFYNVSSPKFYHRWQSRIDAALFFMQLYNAPCCHVCIENPVGFMNTPLVFREPDQIIQPFSFGDPVRKRTCFWLRGLPVLFPTKYVKPNILYSETRHRTYNAWEVSTVHLPSEQRRFQRSIFFPGVAAAMASQWSDYLLHVLYGVPRSFSGMQAEFDFS